MKQKKIIFLIDSLTSGGAQRQLVTLAASIDKSAFDPMVIVYHDRMHYKGLLDEASVPVVLLKKNGRFDLVFLFKLFIFLHKQRPFLLQSFLFMPNILARLIGSIAKVPFIITSERNIDLQQFPFRRFLEKATYRLSDKIVVNAYAIKDLLTQVIGVPEKKISVIHNGIDTERFGNPNSRKINALLLELGLKESDFVITLPGRIAPQKNHDCLLRALTRISIGKQRITILFVGEEYLVGWSSKLRKKIENLNSKIKVIFMGQRKDIAEIYEISSVIVLPSLWEGFPNVVLEAMAAGKPVIASNIADNHRIIDQGVNGYLFANDTDEELANYLDQLLQMSMYDRQAMGHHGMNKIQDEFTLARMVQSFESLYKSLMIDNL